MLIICFYPRMSQLLHQFSPNLMVLLTRTCIYGSYWVLGQRLKVIVTGIICCLNKKIQFWWFSKISWKPPLGCKILLACSAWMAYLLETHSCLMDFQAWGAVIKGTEGIAALLQFSIDGLSTKVMERITALIAEKKAARKAYEDERNRLEKEFSKVCNIWFNRSWDMPSTLSHGRLLHAVSYYHYS